MYGKVFQQIYDGTLAEDWMALVTFQQMIVLCDADGVVDMTPQALARRTGIPLEIIEAGIVSLEAPDRASRTPDHEGRRIERLDAHRPWGWVLVNHRKYQMLQDADTVREQNRERQRKYRERNGPSRDVTPHNACNAPSRHTDTDTDTNTKEKTKTRKPSAAPSVPDGVDVSLWQDWLAVRRAKKQPLTATALEGVKREAAKAKLSLADAIRIAVENGWAGFKFSWLQEQQAKSAKAGVATTDGKPWHQTASGIKAKGEELGLKPEDFRIDRDREDWQAFRRAVLERAGVAA